MWSLYDTFFSGSEAPYEVAKKTPAIVNTKKKRNKVFSSIVLPVNRYTERSKAVSLLGGIKHRLKKKKKEYNMSKELYFTWGMDELTAD